MKNALFILTLITLTHVLCSECENDTTLPIDKAAPKWPPENFKQDRIKEVTTTIVITKPGVYDYSGILHVWKGEDQGCIQDENGPQILRVEASNVTIKNFHYRGDGKEGSHGLGDPIHITTCGDGQGYSCDKKGPVNVILDGIIGHACEDMITIGTPGAKNIEIKNSILFANPNSKCQDKTVQVNFGNNIKLTNNIFVGGTRAIRLKPRETVTIQDNIFYGVKEPIKLSVLETDFDEMKAGPSTVIVKKNKFITCNKALQTDDKEDGKIIESGNTFKNCQKYED
jgi:hypothetical protein